MRLAAFKLKLEQDAKNAPMLRLQGLAQEEAGKDVPVAPDPVNSLTGAGAPTGGLDNAPKQLLGDPKQVLATILNSKTMTDDEKAGAVDQLRKQFAADAASKADAVAGKTRKRTAEEALDAALERAKTSDLEAYAAGKPLAADKTITVPDGASVIDRNGKVIFTNDGKSQRTAELEDRRDARTREAEDRRDERQRIALEAAERRQLAAQVSAEDRAAGRAPAGYRWNADHTELEYIKNGPADPNIKPAGGKPLNDSQAKSLLFGSRMLASNAILDHLAAQGKVYSTPGSMAGYGVGATVNLVNSKEAQKLDQAKRDFLNADLRRESGAVISPSEFDNGEKQYFPQPGDDPEVREQKRRNRLLAAQGILAEVPDWEPRVRKLLGAEAKLNDGGASGEWGITEKKKK